jgi:hypothetical protein
VRSNNAVWHIFYSDNSTLHGFEWRTVERKRAQKDRHHRHRGVYCDARPFFFKARILLMLSLGAADDFLQTQARFDNS